MSSMEELKQQLGKLCEEYRVEFGGFPKVFYDKYPKRTHYLECRGCGTIADWHDIADDYNDDEFGICGECECHECGNQCHENSTHPAYYCDGGCGKKMGCGYNDECQRTCDDCKNKKK